jgi:hypothetical protein
LVNVEIIAVFVENVVIFVENFLFFVEINREVGEIIAHFIEIIFSTMVF